MRVRFALHHRFPLRLRHLELAQLEIPADAHAMHRLFIIRAVLRSFGFGRGLAVVLTVGLVPVSWPLLTLAATMVFQISLRRVRLRQIHLVRCVVYCADVFFWAILMICGLLTWFTWQRLNLPPGAVARSFVNEEFVGLMIFLSITAMIPIFVYRLIIAFKRYLQFDHPIATVLTTQLLAFLAGVTILLQFAY